MSPFVSIVMPAYNSSEFISDAINSVLNQTFIDWELIIVDDCSTDNTVGIVQKFSELDSRIKIILLTENSGAAVARNAAIFAAQGRYISFLDSDDRWRPRKLDIQLDFMRTNSYVFSYAGYEKINTRGDVFDYAGVAERVSYVDLLKSCQIGCLTAIYDTAFFGKVYMPNIRKRQDLGLWLNLLKFTNFAYGLNIPLAQYRVRPGSISSNKLYAAKFQWSLYRKIEKLNLVKSVYYFSHYALRGLIRTKFPHLARILGVAQ